MELALQSRSVQMHNSPNKVVRVGNGVYLVKASGLGGLRKPQLGSY